MSQEQLKAFLEKVKTDSSLQEKLKAATDADAVVEIAKEAGFAITTDVLNKDQSEISDLQLESAAGGAITDHCFDTLFGRTLNACECKE